MSAPAVNGARAAEAFDAAMHRDSKADERAVLGAMMMAKPESAVPGEIREMLRPPDAGKGVGEHHFAVYAHGLIWKTIIALMDRGEPFDALAVHAEIEPDKMQRIGGIGYLHTCVESCLTIANGTGYARNVANATLLRQLAEAASVQAQAVLASSLNGAEEVYDRARAALDRIAPPARRGNMVAWEVAGPEALDEMDRLQELAAQSEEDRDSVFSTGWPDVDRLLGPVAPGSLIVIAARPGVGKALALNTPLVTPTGWTTMGEVQEGDLLIDAQGRPTRVVAATGVLHGRPCYEVEFSDGSSIVADALHQWSVSTRASRRQAAENKAAYFWSAEDRAHVTSLRERIEAGPDRLMATSEFLSLAGRRFRTVLFAALKGVPAAGKVEVVYTRIGKRTTRLFDARSSHLLARLLCARVHLRMNAATAVAHSPIVTTEQMAAAVRVDGDERLNYAVRVAEALQFPEAELPIAPYTFGAWLGDGDSKGGGITSADPELLAYIEDDGYEVRPSAHPMHFGFSVPAAQWEQRRSQICLNCGTKMRWYRPTGWCMPCIHARPTIPGMLRKLGVMQNKHIPQVYLRASEAQRRALLAGLLDTDGTAAPNGSVQFSVTSQRLARDTRELILSLGYRCTVSEKSVGGRTADSSIAYQLTFSTSDEVFRLERKKLAHKERRRTVGRKRVGVRYVTAVRPIPSVPVRCVEVDNIEHLYLAGETMIPTHNSVMSRNVVQHLAMRRGLPAVFFSLEMSRLEISVAMMAAGARINRNAIKNGTMSDEDWTAAAKYLGATSAAPLELVDTSAINQAYIDQVLGVVARKYARAPAAYVIDYLQLAHEKGHGNRQEEVAAMSRGHKLLAKDHQTVAIAVSQLNRNVEGRADKRPQLSDLRESGSIEQDADVVILLDRPDYQDEESPRAGEVDLIVAKNRNGPTGTVTLAAQLHLSRFVSMAIT